MKFWDSSAIIPLCVEEGPTAYLRSLAEEDNLLIVWWGTPVECCSALARRSREEIMSSTDEANAHRALAFLLHTWTEIEPSQEIRETSGRILRLHPLRAADSLQLAAALLWANRRPTGYEVVCLDQRLRTAAQREGFTILPESL